MIGPATGTVPGSSTRRYQPVRPSALIRWPMSRTRVRSVSLKHGHRGWQTSSSASPQAHRSPMHTSASVTPTTVTFSPNVPGPTSMAISEDQRSKCSEL